MSQTIKFFSAPIPHCLALAVLLRAASVSAGQLTWDPLGNGGTSSASGNWDTTAGNTVWYNGGSDVAWTQNSGTSPLNSAVFNGPDAAPGTYVVTLDASEISLTNVSTINANGYTFSGANAIYVGTSNFLSVAAGKTATFNCPMAGSAQEPCWTLGSGATMNVTSNLTSSQQVRLAGAAGSAFNLSGPANAPAIVWILAPVNLTSGSLIPSSSFYIGYAETLPPPNSTAYSSGILTISGSSTVFTVNGNIFIIGRSGGSGTLNVQNGTVTLGNSTATRSLAIDYDGSAGSSGAVNVSGGTLTVGSSTELANEIAFFYTGASSASATATLTQSGGTINTWGGIVFGSGGGAGTASLTQSGGALYVGASGITKGASYAGPYSITLTGGTVGALAGNWASSLPMTLAASNGNTTFQCGNGNTAYNISLSGPLTDGGLGGGLCVIGGNGSGGGTLTLSGANNYGGSTVVSNGTLAIVTGATPSLSGPVTLDASTGSPTLSIEPSPGQYWTNNGTLTYQNATGGTPTADFNFGALAPSATVAPLQIKGGVAFSATPNVTVEGSAIAAGTYPLIKYTGAVSGTMPASANVTLSGGVASGYVTNLAASKTIALVVTSSTYNPALYWGIGNGIWNTTALNWKQFGIATNYTDGNAVVFDDSASGPSPMTVTLNTTVNPLAVTFNNAAPTNYTISGTGSISGSGNLSILGSGTVTLSCTNTYNGATVLSAGQLNINNGGTASASAIGTGTLTINAGASIDNTSGANVTLQPTIPEIWNGNFTYLGSANNFNTGAGPVTMNESISLAVNANNLIVGGSISDNGNNLQLTKTGNGALTLPVGNSFGGGLTLSSGLLNLGDPNAAGQGTLTIAGGAIDNVSGAPLTLAAPAEIWEGSFSFLGSTNLDIGPLVTVTVPPGQSSLTVNVVSNTLQNDYNIVSGNTTVIKTGNGIWNITGTSTSVNNFQLVVNAGQVNLAKFSGQTIGGGNIGFTVNAGALAIDMNANYQVHSDSPTTPVPVVLSGGTWDLNGYSENIDKFSMNNGATLRNGASSASLFNLISGYTAMLTGTNCQFDVAAGGLLTFQGPIGGAGSLVTTGPGVLDLLSNNIYTGNTVIGNGTLALSGAGSISNSAVINLVATNSAMDLTDSSFVNGNGNPLLTLQSGQTLSGFGVVTGLVVSLTGSTVAPGSSAAIGVLTVTGYNDVNTLNGATMMKLNKSSRTNDQLAVSGSLVYGGTLVLTNLSGSLAAGDSFALFNAAGGYSGTFAGLVPARPDFPAFGLAWNTNNLAVNGTLSIVAASIPPPPRITSVTLSGTTLSILGTNGVANEPFVLLESATLAAPLAHWTPVLTNAFNGSGNFNVSLSVTGGPEEFFALFVQ